MKHRMILSFLRNFCLILGISTIGIYATPLPYPGQNIWHVAAEIGTDVDLLLSKLDECCATLISTVTTNCDPIPLYQTNVINGGILLTTTGASYCLSQNITGSIIISASDVTVDLNMHSLIGTIDIIGTSSNVTIQNGNVKPAAPTNSIDAAHAAIVIGADAYNTLIKNVSVINADSVGFVGRDGINNAGTNTIIDSNVIQAGSGTPTGGSGIINSGLNVSILRNKIVAGIGSSSIAAAYVTNLTNDTVSVVDTATNTIVATITVGTTPFNVAITPDGTKAYVANNGSDTVSVIDTATNTVINTITVGNGPTGIAITPDGTKAYVTNNNDDTVSVIDTATNTVIATIPVNALPADIAITPDGTTAYVTNSGNSTVDVIDTATNTVIATITVGITPRDVAITPNGTKAYVTNQTDNTVSVIDIATNTVIATITVGSTPFGVDVTPDGSKAYVVNAVSSTVSVIDIATDTVITTIPVGASPRFIAITPDGTKGYVTNLGASTVSVINIATNTVIATITGFTLPIGIDITPAGFGGNGIVQEGSQGQIIDNIVTGGAGSLSNSGGAGILVSAATNCNIIQECLAVDGSGDGFTILTTGTVNLIDCIASCNAADGFDLSQSTGRGIVKRCEALQNIGCGFKDRSDSLYQYVSNSSEGNDGSPAVPAGDTNYCWSDFTSTFTPPSGPGSRPFYQWARNGDDGTFFGVSSWDNVTLP